MTDKDDKDKTITNKMDTIVCNHCHEKIKSPELANLTLVCPHCKKSVNGQYYGRFNKSSDQKNPKL